MRPGEVRFTVVAPNIEQARRTIESARLTVEGSPVLRGMLKAQTADELLFELPSGARSAIRSFPCSSRGVRPTRRARSFSTRARTTSHRGRRRNGPAGLRRIEARHGPVRAALPGTADLESDGDRRVLRDAVETRERGRLPGWAAYKLHPRDEPDAQRRVHADGRDGEPGDLRLRVPRDVRGGR